MSNHPNTESSSDTNKHVSAGEAPVRTEREDQKQTQQEPNHTGRQAGGAESHGTGRVEQGSPSGQLQDQPPQDQPRGQATPTPAEVAGAEMAKVEAQVDAKMRSQMDAAMREAAQTPQVEAPKRAIRGPRVVQAGREHRKGTVVSVGPTDVFIEFGPKELGVVQRIQYKTEAELPAVGEEIEVVVNRYEASEGLFICSKPGAVVKADWEMLEPGQTVEARVTGVNKGGLELEIANHRAFMPAGQVSLDRIEDLSVFVGEKLTCQVQRVDRRGKGNIVLSRREMLQKEREEAASRLQETLEEGQVVEGTVRKIMPFGAFVDIGGIDGLVHVSDLTHERVGHGEKAIERHISVGQKVTAQILKVDWAQRRISLGMKQLQDDPFKAQLSEVQEGAELSGKITKIMEFGAFVEIAPGVEGLVHISEIDYRRVNRVEDVLSANEVVQVKVLKIDPDSRRVSLSIKALKAPPKQAGGRGKKEDRGPSADEILKETPKLRRMREQAKQKQKGAATGGLGDLGGLDLGQGLGNLKL